MSLPIVIANNQTAGAISLNRLGLTVPLSSTLTLTDYAFVDEIKQDESLHAAIVADEILLDLGQGELNKGDSLKFFVVTMLEVRRSVRALSASNVVSLSGTTTIDTVSLVAGDRVLLTAQTTASENGIWVIQSGAWTRPSDFNTGDSTSGSIIAVDDEGGTTYGGQVWQIISLPGSDIVGTDNLSAQQLSGGAGADTLQSAYDNGATITTAGSVDIGFTLTSGNFTVDGAGNVVFGGTTPLGDFSVDTGTMSLDSTDTTNLTMTANDAGTKVLTIAASNSGGGVGDIQVTSDGTTFIDAAGGVEINSTGGSLNLGNDADTGAINIGTGAAARTITIGNNTGATGVAIETGSGNLLVDAPLTTLTGNLLVEGTTTTVHSEIVNIADNFLYLNADYTTASAEEGGIVVNYLPTSSVDAVATGGFTARAGATNAFVEVDEEQTAIAAGSDAQTLPQATINVADTTGFPASGTIYVTTTSGVQTVTYTGTTATTFTGCSGGVGTMNTGNLVSTSANAIVAGDFIQVSGAADQTNDGLYEVLSNINGTLSIKGLGTTPGTYSFTQNDFVTDTTVQGTITKVTVGAIQVDSGGDWQVGSGSSSTDLTFVDIITSATISLQTAYDGGNTITTSGGVDVVIAGTDGLQITGSGGLDVDTIADFDVTTFDVQMTGNNGFSIDGTADSNVTATNTVTSTDVTMTVEATNTGATAGDATVDINATSTNGSGIIDIDADDTITMDVLTGGTIGIGTDASVSTTTIGNTTGTSGVVVNSGTEMVEIDGVTYYGASAGLPTATSSGFQDGDKYFDTNLDMEMRYDATRAKWLSIEVMVFHFGRDGNTQANQYYRAADGRVMSSTLGWIMPYAGTITGLGYTRTDTDSATFDVVEGGTSRATLASAAVSGVSSALDGNFSASGILAVQNLTGGNTTSNVIGWVRVKFRGT